MSHDDLIARQRDTWMLCCRNAERARDEAIAHRERAEAERDAVQHLSAQANRHRDELLAENAKLRALLREARGHLQYGTQPSELFLRIDAALKEKP